MCKWRSLHSIQTSCRNHASSRISILATSQIVCDAIDCMRSLPLYAGGGNCSCIPSICRLLLLRSCCCLLSCAFFPRLHELRVQRLYRVLCSLSKHAELYSVRMTATRDGRSCLPESCTLPKSCRRPIIFAGCNHLLGVQRVVQAQANIFYTHVLNGGGTVAVREPIRSAGTESLVDFIVALA